MIRFYYRLIKLFYQQLVQISLLAEAVKNCNLMDLLRFSRSKFFSFIEVIQTLPNSDVKTLLKTPRVTPQLCKCPSRIVFLEDWLY